MYRTVMIALLIAASLATPLAGCVTSSEDDPSADELQDLDAWAEASDGKADLPSSWTELVAWIKDFYRNRLSAVWSSQEHPATSAAAITRVRGLLAKAGISDPEHRLYRMTVQRLRFSELADHSEINIQLAPHQVVRLIGDPKGAGLFVDGKRFQTALVPSLCLTWDELVTAIEASYLPGAYGTDFVCHTVTERVLRALRIGSSTFTAQIHTYAIARYVWGPQLPSGNPQSPSQWPESRSCPN